MNHKISVGVSSLGSRASRLCTCFISWSRSTVPKDNFVFFWIPKSQSTKPCHGYSPTLHTIAHDIKSKHPSCRCSYCHKFIFKFQIAGWGCCRAEEVADGGGPAQPALLRTAGHGKDIHHPRGCQGWNFSVFWIDFFSSNEPCWLKFGVNSFFTPYLTPSSLSQLAPWFIQQR